MIALPLGEVLGWFALPFLAYTTAVVQGFAKLPGSLKISESGTSWLLILLALTAGVYLLARRYPKQAKPTILIMLCASAAMVGWMGVAARPDGKLHIRLPGLENSHAVLIQTPLGQTYLINGAASGRELTARLDASISPFNRELDGLILTDSEAKPLGGLPFLAEQVKVDNVLWGELVPANPATRRLEAALRQDGAISNLLEEGQEFLLEPGLTLRIIASGESGTALVLDYGNFILLIPYGLSPQELQKNMGRLLFSRVIVDKGVLVDASSQEWIPFSTLGILWNESRALVPLKDWISTGEYGQVELTTDGVTMTLENFK
jgi:hypothetical protein